MIQSKYQPLLEHLRRVDADEVVMTIDEIERVLDERLPPSARTQRAWWSNRRKGAVQAQAWMGAGYHVEEIDLDAGRITFRKPGKIYRVRRKGDTVLWNGEMVKALRHHLGLSQMELAEELGVRQQTISEWENGIYEPKRSSSKLLSFFAERVDFPYDVES
jgi:DNA-binding XRE family transcriptional regulator